MLRKESVIRICRDPLYLVQVLYVNSIFAPPEVYEIMLFAENIDVHSSSGVYGITTKICKSVLLHTPVKFRLIFANSMLTGYFPFS